jgi:predicted DNA-binding antitoxin AbrB/MazE fold protein
MAKEGGDAMGRKIEVIYEAGVFKPTVPVLLKEGERLTLYIPYEDDGMTHEQRVEATLKLQKEFQDAWDELSEADQAAIEEAWKRRR